MIQKLGSYETLPRAHTCFNRYDIYYFVIAKIKLSNLKIFKA